MSERTDPEVQAGHCPSCGHVINRHECVSDPGKQPGPGDYAACICCLEVFKFGAAGRFVKLSLREEFELLDSDLGELIMRTRALLAAVKATSRERERGAG